MWRKQFEKGSCFRTVWRKQFEKGSCFSKDIATLGRRHLTWERGRGWGGGEEGGWGWGNATSSNCLDPG